MAQSKRVRLYRESKHGCVLWRRQSEDVSIRQSWPQRASRSRFCLERFLSNEMVSPKRGCKVTLRHSVLQCLQPSEFRTSEHGPCWDSGQTFYRDRVWSADVHDFPA